MLLVITNYEEIDGRKLMDIYKESNLDNTDYFYPAEKNKDIAVKNVEDGFLDYLQNEFFIQNGSIYWVYEVDGMWVSALRTNLIKPGLLYIEAFETRPDQRKKGYASKLLASIVQVLKQIGPFKLCSCVNKKNEESLNVHLKFGFKKVAENGYNYLLNSSEELDYGLEFTYPEK